jgi:hypothetical protein
MCRLYKTKKGDYVRLCYYHGKRRGERIPFFDLPKDIGDDFISRRIFHIPRTKATLKVIKPSYNKALMKKEPVRCRKCGAPMNRSNYAIGICDLCQRGR